MSTNPRFIPLDTDVSADVCLFPPTGQTFVSAITLLPSTRRSPGRSGELSLRHGVKGGGAFFYVTGDVDAHFPVEGTKQVFASVSIWERVSNGGVTRYARAHIVPQGERVAHHLQAHSKATDLRQSDKLLFHVGIPGTEGVFAVYELGTPKTS